MKSDFHLMVPGADGGPTAIEVKSPFSGERIGSVQAAGEAAVEQALTNARRVFDDPDAHLPAWERIEILRATAAALEANAEEMALGAAAEGGKPLRDSRVEVSRAVDGIHSCIDVLRTQAGEEIPMGLNPASANRLAFTSHEPVGPVLAFSAFNHPVNLIVHQIMPAVATGCPFIVKPAASTPLSCFRLVQMLHEAGWPKEWGQPLAIKDHDLSNKAVADDRIAFFTFIGGPSVGWRLKARLAPGVGCALEHGGAAPVIVSEDADLDEAIPRLAKAAFYHAGQVCVSAQRIYVHESRFQEFSQKLAEAANGLKVGDPSSPETDVGPLISPSETKRIGQWVQHAVETGGRILCGGQVHPQYPEACYQPTVLVNPADDAEVSEQEIFGPVVCLYGYTDLDEAIRRANAVPFSFQAAVFAKSINTIMHCYRHLKAENVMANEHPAFRVDWMPFGGGEHSGYGTGGIPYTMADMQHKKMLVLRSS